MKKPIVVMGIDPGTKSIGISMCEVTEHGIRILPQPTPVLYRGKLRSGHGTIQVARRKMPLGHYWNKVNDIVKTIGANLALPGYMMEEGGRIDLFDIANKAARKTSVDVEELQQSLVSKFLRDWAKPMWAELENRPVNPPPVLTSVYDSDAVGELYSRTQRTLVAEDIVSRAFGKLRDLPGIAPTIQELADFINEFATGRLGLPKRLDATVEDGKVVISVAGIQTMTIEEKK